MRAIGDIFIHRQAVEQRAFLKDNAHALAHLVKFFLAEVGNLCAINEDLPAVRFEQAENQPQDR